MRVRKRDWRIALFTLQILEGFQFGCHAELVCITDKYGGRWRSILLAFFVDGICNDLLLLVAIAVFPMRIEEKELNVCCLVPESGHGHPIPSHQFYDKFVVKRFDDRWIIKLIEACATP